MSFVYKKPTDDTWAAVHVLVVAPRCEVNIPVMQLQWHISNCMRKIPPDCDTQGSAVTRYELYIEELA
jgi:hypothetical protein